MEIVPGQTIGLLPLRFATAISIFDDNAHTGCHHMLADFTHNPNTGVVHLNDGADSLSGREAKHGDKARLRHMIAVESDDAKLMAGERDPVQLRGAGVEDMQKNLLTGFYTERLSKA